MNGAYSVFSFAAADALWLVPSTHVHGPQNLLGPVRFSIVGFDMQVDVEGLTGQVSKAEAYAKFHEPDLVA